MEDTNAFFDTIRKGELKATLSMLRANPNLVNVKDQRGSTPLILAAYYGNAEMVKAILDKGANIDDEDASGNTALMGVCFKGFLVVAKILLVNGANANHQNQMGASCLIYAVTYNQFEIAKLLIENGAKVGIKDAKGNTALDHAKLQGSPALIDLLEGQAG